MEVEFRQRGITYETKSIVPVMYSGHCVGHGEADLIVFFPNGENYVIELKAVSGDISRLHTAQVRTYLRGRPDVQYGVVINFTQPNSANAESGVQSVSVSALPVSVPVVDAVTTSVRGTEGTDGTVSSTTSDGVSFSDNICHDNDNQ